MKILYDSFSECGPRRNNEDYIAVRELSPEGRSVFVLCDGMGGHALGEVASRLVAEHICDYWEMNPHVPDSAQKILDACRGAKDAFDRKSRVEMGTTMTMAAIEGNRALLAHCGDSRIYMVRDREIIYQSEDHVALNPEGWPMITRAFFTDSDIYRPDIREVELRPGDLILLCSDGVYGYQKWSELNAVLLGDPEAVTLDKVKSVAGRKAHDNYSAILIRVCEDPATH